LTVPSPERPAAVEGKGPVEVKYCSGGHVDRRAGIAAAVGGEGAVGGDGDRSGVNKYHPSKALSVLNPLLLKVPALLKVLVAVKC